MSYEFYKLMHLGGLVCLFFGLGAALFSFAGSSFKAKAKILAFSLHGFGLIFLLVGGFGLLARLGIVQGGLPSWVYLKLAIWCILGLMISIIKRKSNWIISLSLGIIALGFAGAAIGVFKPTM